MRATPAWIWWLTCLTLSLPCLVFYLRMFLGADGIFLLMLLGSSHLGMTLLIVLDFEERQIKHRSTDVSSSVNIPQMRPRRNFCTFSTKKIRLLR